MKKKEARKLLPGDKLVMVRDGSYCAQFKAGDKVSFVRNEGGQRIEVLGLWEGREIDQTIDRKDVELYTEPNETPAQPERPHEVLRATYKAGQEWEFKARRSQHWLLVHSGHTPCEPTWYKGHEYRLKPEPLDAAPELYCVVYKGDTQVCSIDGSQTFRTGALSTCNQLAEHLRRNFPSEKYRVMRLTPVDSSEGRTTA